MKKFLASHKANVGLIILKWPGFKIQHSEILRSDIPSKLLGYEFCHKMKSPWKKNILICFINSYTREVLIDTDKINS